MQRGDGVEGRPRGDVVDEQDGVVVAFGEQRGTGPRVLEGRVVGYFDEVGCVGVGDGGYWR